MWNRQDWTRRLLRRKKIARRLIPLVEAAEPRLVMSTSGFLQGSVFVNNSYNQVGSPTNAYPNPFSPSTGGTVVAGATVDLFQGASVPNPLPSPYMTTASASDGSYSFTGLAAGTYTIVEIPPAGYGNETTAVESPLNPVTATTSNSITVQVVDPTTLAVNFDSGNPYSPSTTTGEFARLPGGISFTYVSGTQKTTEEFSIGQLPITVTGTDLPTTTEFSAFCVNVLEGLGFSPDGFDAVGQSSGSAVNANGNAGRIGYLYDQYINYLVDQFGNPLSNTAYVTTEPFTKAQAYEADALQLAIWELEYNAVPNTPISTNPSSSSFQTFWSTGAVQGFSLLNGVGITNDPSGITDVESMAAQFINDSDGQSEQAIVLQANPSSEGYQSLLAPGSLNFSNNLLATPSITTSQQPASATVGTSIADQATVTGGDNPTGTVTFNLYNNINGTGTPLYTDANVPLVNGVATSAGYTATATGTDYWVATYNGDSNNNSVSSPASSEPVVISPATPSINTTQQPASATVGSSIADQATVSGGYNPTGTVTFALYDNANGTGTPLFIDADEPLVNGVATSAGYTTTATGTDYWVATYNGDSNNNAVTSTTYAEPVVISPATPAINTTQQPASATVGSSIADQATVSGGYNPTGTVTFALYDNANGTGTPLFIDADEPLVNGVAMSAGYTTTATGTDYWVATYNGDSNNNAVTSTTYAEPVVITPATPAINTTQQPASAIVGTSIADQATVSGGYNPTGTVTFNLYNNPNGTGTPLYTDANEPLINGVATSAGYTATATGTDYWVATYNGDSNNYAVTSTTYAEPVVISPATPCITTTPTQTLTPGATTISGTKYLDLTGNGFSSDDTPQGGVTIDLYKPTSSGGETLVASTTTASNGTYSFSVANPGTYYVQEVVPSGYIQTGGGPDGSAGDTYYTVNVASGYRYSGYNFDDFLIPICAPSNVSYKVTTPSGCSRTVTNLSGNTQQGDTVTATFTVPSGMNDTLTLVSYSAPSSCFSDSNAYEQVIYQQATGTFGPGTHSLTVKIPNNDYQIDFVCGQAINELEPNQNNDAYGPDSAEILYHAQDRFLSSDNSGTTCPSLPTPPTPMTPNPTSASTMTMNLNDSATLSGGYNPTGTITFYLLPPGATSSTPLSSAVYTDTVTINGNGIYTTSMGSNPGGYDATTTGTYEWVAIYNGDSNNNGATSCFGSEPTTVNPSLSFTGTVYCDMNVDGTLDNGDQGLAGITVTLTYTPANGTTATSITTTTNSSGVYTFAGVPLSNASGYTLSVATPTGDFAGSATVGMVNNQSDGTASTTSEATTNIVVGNGFQYTGTGYNFGLMLPSSLSGEVLNDGKEDCKQDSCDQGLVGVTVTLTGTNDQGKSVSISTTTNSSGDYSFTGLAPGSYTITVTPPNGFTADAASVGSAGGKVACNSSINTIDLGGCGTTGINYNFSLIGSGTCSTQTQTCSYWCGSNGQSLIHCLNGGSSCTNLGNWLASTCPNLFGSLKGCTNSQVASYCKTLANGNSNQKACAQVLSTALCTFVTNSTLAGNTGSSYGFNVSANGLGASTWNVGSYGSGIGLSNSQSYSITALLSQIDSQASNESLNLWAVNTISALCTNINGH
jgi:hypothetical protein